MVMVWCGLLKELGSTVENNLTCNILHETNSVRIEAIFPIGKPSSMLSEARNVI